MEETRKEIRKYFSQITQSPESDIVEVELTSRLFDGIRSRAIYITHGLFYSTYARVEGTPSDIDVLYSLDLNLVWCRREDLGTLLGEEALNYLLKDF